MAAAAQKKDPVEVSARAAAADAAAVARDEALQQGPASVGRLEAAGKEAARAARAKWVNFQIDVWLTPFNSIEFGFWKRDRNKGKSRQFTSDMDIFAEITENGERSGVIGYRKELWKDASGMDKRLVLKLFSETLSWRASMDMMLGRSVQQTVGARGFPVVTYSINTSDDEFLVTLERSANKWPLLPENYSFFIMDEGVPKFYRFRRDVINIGGDYTLLDQHGEVAGHVNGSILTVGGKWRCTVRGDHADPRVVMVMKLFVGMIAFGRETRSHVRNIAREVRAGRMQPNLQRQEADLYLNPRRGR